MCSGLLQGPGPSVWCRRRPGPAAAPRLRLRRRGAGSGPRRGGIKLGKTSLAILHGLTENTWPESLILRDEVKHELHPEY